MKQFAILLTALLLLPKPVFAQNLPSAPQPAATDDANWDRLTWLDPDSMVSITAAGHGPIRCGSLHVADQELSCQSAGLFARSYDLSRSQVERVNLRRDKRNFWIGIGAMSAVGFAVGASQYNLEPYQPRVVNGVLGASLLGFASSPFVFAVVHLLPGKTIYRRGSKP
jgi:hypothetical protein